MLGRETTVSLTKTTMRKKRGWGTDIPGFGTFRKWMQGVQKQSLDHQIKSLGAGVNWALQVLGVAKNNDIRD
jgi:hypothetical protein